MIRLLRTACYLRPIQIVDRVRRRFYSSKPDLSPPPPLRTPAGTWRQPIARPPRLLPGERFHCLNVTHSIAGPDAWQQATPDRLWLYNLHYFDDFRASDDEAHTALLAPFLARWLVENLPGQSPGWDPYPISLRIVNWVAWSLAGGVLPPEAVASLAVQVRYLAGRLEYHLLANHLWANAKALVFAGAFFEGRDAEAWLADGITLVDEQLAEQVLDDGGHFELSTMYHAIVLEDLLDLCNLAAAYPHAQALASRAEKWRDTAQRMRAWLAAMSHPDGQIGLFNDAAFEIAPVPAELGAYAARLGHPNTSPPAQALTHLPASGYLRLARGPAVLLVDAARIGPDYQPGHAHADTLTCELSLHGRRVLVNSGTSCYGDTAERLYERSTAAHNTVVVDGENSSEVWHSHRVARRARPLDLEVTPPTDVTSPIEVACSHDGYRRLPGRVTHRRRWQLAANQLALHDSLSGRFHTAELFLHFHPEVRLEPSADSPVGESRWQLTREGQPLAKLTLRGAEVRQEPGAYHPRFGESLPNQRLVARFAATEVETCLEW